MADMDRISSLPDEILYHIVSFIPTKFSIRTSALSKRWKHVWQGTSSISIDRHSENRFILNNIRRSFSGSKITSFDFSISDIRDTNVIDRWIEIATSHNVENLSLNIEALYRLPDSFFVSSDVKKLHLTLERFRQYGPQRAINYDMMNPNCIVSWSSLKELSLNCCDLPDEAFAKIISGCPMLESLILNRCRRFHTLDLSKSGNLKKLEICFGWDYTSGPREIIAPHIRYLKLTGCFAPCTLVGISSATEVYFSLNEYYPHRNVNLEYVQGLVVQMLAKLQMVEKLTVQGVILQILSLTKLCGVPFPQLKTKELIVEMMVVQTVMPGIAQLLENSPELKKITVYTVKGKAIADTKLNEYLLTKDLNPFQCWSGFFPVVEPESTYFDGYVLEGVRSQHVASLVEFVLRNSESLETMVLRLKGYLRPREYPKLLPKVPTEFRDKNGKPRKALTSFKIIP